MYQRICDYCRKPIIGGYFYITHKRVRQEDVSTHMCKVCWNVKATRYFNSRPAVKKLRKMIAR